MEKQGLGGTETQEGSKRILRQREVFGILLLLQTFTETCYNNRFYTNQNPIKKSP
jgi:hypothetical protein